MIFGCTGLVLIILMTFINVVCRYSFGFIITPFEEISLILFVWCCYIGASASATTGTSPSTQYTASCRR